MATTPRKRSFFERLTGSIRMQDEEEFIAPVTPAKKTALYNRYDEEYEDDETVATSVQVVAEEEPTEAQLSVDVYETDGAIIVKTMTAGVKKEDLEINVSRESLTIRGRRDNDSRSYQHNYHTQELYWGSFSRIIELPDEIDIEQASAVEHHGLVTIKLPKFDKKRKAVLKVQ